MVGGDDALQTQEDEDTYPTFLVNRALSYHLDTVMVAVAMNQYPTIDKRMHYDFVRAMVRKTKRRYQKWSRKDETDANLKAVKTFYKLSDEKAAVAVRVLTTKQLAEIIEQVDLGGQES